MGFWQALIGDLEVLVYGTDPGPEQRVRVLCGQRANHASIASGERIIQEKFATFFLPVLVRVR